VVESAPTAELFGNPRHPYTQKLIAATPHHATNLRELTSIRGNLPDLRREDLPACRFSERCERAVAPCKSPLKLATVAPGHQIACWNPL